MFDPRAFIVGFQLGRFDRRLHLFLVPMIRIVISLPNKNAYYLKTVHFKIFDISYGRSTGKPWYFRIWKRGIEFTVFTYRFILDW